MKVSIVIPVYYNEDNLRPLYNDLKVKFIDNVECAYELVMVNDGSKDKSYAVMQELANEDKNIKIISLSRNFGSHAATLCGLGAATGDCIIVKSADLQEPTEIIIDMINSWKKGNNVVLAVRAGREESRRQVAASNFYYWLVRKTSLPTMPKMGFDVWLVDKKVKDVLLALDEKNSSITGQILWAGFKTDQIYYIRKAREIGKSKWTLKKKVRLVMDTLFSFSTVPIKCVTLTGVLSLLGAVVWASIEVIAKLSGQIDVAGWTTLFIFNLFSFGVIMFSIGIIGEYTWRIFDSSRNRPPYIIEEQDGQQEKRG